MRPSRMIAEKFMAGIRLCLCTVLFLLLLSRGVLVARGADADRAQLEEKETVRVVLVDYADHGYVVTEGDSVSGYYMDYLEEIAKYTGWQYDIRVVSQDSELFRITAGKDFDLMVGIAYSRQNENRYFRYPCVAMGQKRMVLASAKTHAQLDMNDPSDYEGIKVGVVDTSYGRDMKEKFKSYCFTNGIICSEEEGEAAGGIRLVEVDSEERFKMLEDGTLDAVITTDSLALEHGLYVLKDFGNSFFYAVAPKGDDHLMEELEAAMSSIKGLDRTFEDRLYEKYFQDNYRQELAFSEEELAYMETPRRLKVAFWDYCAPYSYVNDKGEWSGIAVEVFRQITEDTEGGIQFEFVGCEDSFEANEALATGRVDILGQTFTSVKASSKRDRSNSFFTDYFSIYRNKTSNKSMEECRIVVKKDVTDSMLQSLGVTDSTKVIRVENVAEALRMVNSGKADMTFALQKVADYYINYYQMNNIKELELTNDVAFCCVYGEGMDPVLREICNKCITCIDTASLDRMTTRYILQDHRKPTLWDYFKENRTAVLTGIVILVSLLAGYLAVMLFLMLRKSNRIYEMLYRDEITGGSSYLKFQEDAKKLTAREAGEYDVIFCDISSFKYINDMFGYEVGNQVICLVNEMMTELAEGYPMARMYADHFVGIRPYSGRENLEALLKEKLQSFNEMASGAFPDFNIFLKFGIYTWDTRSGETEIRKIVNRANYAAGNITNLSKSEYRFYTRELHDKVLERQVIEKDMHRALEDGEFVAYFQPKYDAVKDEIIGAEALVRWKHKTKGLISPGAFVPIFEDNGFIIEVDFCILEQVCTLLKERKDRGEKLYPISCNFSRCHFKRPDFVERVTQTVEKYQVDPHYLELEITETVATSDFHVLIDTVHIFKQKGFGISIDDFGSGYSCIQLLYKLPIDVLKIDRDFVEEQADDTPEADLNRSIVNICHAHNIRIICEGVETLQQKEYVLSYGCRYIQGFLYSRPVDKETFLKMLS